MPMERYARSRVSAATARALSAPTRQQPGQFAPIVHQLVVAGSDRIEHGQHCLAGGDLERAVLLVLVGDLPAVSGR